MYLLPDQEETPSEIVAQLVAEPNGPLARKLAAEIDQAQRSALERLQSSGMPAERAAEQAALLNSVFDGAREVLDICAR